MTRSCCKIFVLVFCGCALLLQGNFAQAAEQFNTETDIKLLPSVEVPNFGARFFEELKSESSPILRLNYTLAEGILDNVPFASADMRCALQLQAITSGIQNNEMWALKLLDAWGKFPSGIFRGHLMEMGNFDECINLQHTFSAENTLQGKYCMSSIPLGRMLTDSPLAKQLNIKIGICIPAACSASTIDVVLKKLLSTALQLDESVFGDAILLKDKSCKISRKDDKFEAVDWVAISILIVLAVCMVLSTCYDYVATLKENKLHPLLSAFSVRANLRQLMHINPQRNSPHVIHCLHGIRCLSLVWVVYGHCFMLMLMSPHINTVDLLAWSRTPFSMFIQSATISVDTFFFLSGMLLIMVSLRQMERTGGKINVPLMWIHRYLRLTPVLALAILLFVSLYRYMGDGPMWNLFTSTHHACEQTWWATLLYVQNYATNGNMCLGHSWYLAVDTQLYFISPIVLIAIWKWKKNALAALAIFGLLLLACMMTTIIINDLGVSTTTMLADGGAMMNTVYTPTHTRALPWIIGIIFGYFLHSRSGRRVQLSSTVIALGWLCSLALIFTTIFVLYPKTLAGATPLTPVEGAFYWSLVRIAWPLALAWIVFACMQGYGGPVNQFLSWSFWQPMGKLSYCMYIWHLFVETINAGRIKTNTNFSDYDTILRFWGDFGITVLVSFVMYLAIEAPMAGIEKFLFPKNKTKPSAPEPVAAAAISQQSLCNK